MKTLLAILLLSVAALPAMANGTPAATGGAPALSASDAKAVENNTVPVGQPLQAPGKITEAYNDTIKAELVKACQNDWPQALEKPEEMSADQYKAACQCMFDFAQTDTSGAFNEQEWRAVAYVMSGKRGTRIDLPPELSQGLSDKKRRAIYTYPMIYAPNIKDPGLIQCMKDRVAGVVPSITKN